MSQIEVNYLNIFILVITSNAVADLLKDHLVRACAKFSEKITFVTS